MGTASQVLLTQSPVSNAGPMASNSATDIPGAEKSSDDRAFSSLLDGQQQASKQPASVSKSATETSQTDQIGNPDASQEDTTNLLLALAGGNLLPIEGEDLPLNTLHKTMQTQLQANELEIDGAIGSQSSISLLESPSNNSLVTGAVGQATIKSGQKSEAQLQPVELNLLTETAHAIQSGQLKPTVESGVTATVSISQTPIAPSMPSPVSKVNVNSDLKQQNNLHAIDVEFVSDDLMLDDSVLLPKKSLAEIALNTKIDKAPAITMESLNTLAQVAEVASSASQSPQTYQQLVTAANQTQLTVPVMMTRPGWGEAVVDKVMWMSAQHLKTAEIALDPPELGALQIRVSTQNDQTSVSFTSPNANVREALDQNMNRLRDMIQGEGLQLVDAEVSEQRSSRDQQSADTEGQKHGDELLDEQGSPQHLATGDKIRIASPVGLVDQYV